MKCYMTLVMSLLTAFLLLCGDNAFAKRLGGGEICGAAVLER